MFPRDVPRPSVQLVSPPAPQAETTGNKVVRMVASHLLTNHIEARLSTEGQHALLGLTRCCRTSTAVTETAARMRAEAELDALEAWYEEQQRESDRMYEEESEAMDSWWNEWMSRHEWMSRRG